MMFCIVARAPRRRRRASRDSRARFEQQQGSINIHICRHIIIDDDVVGVDHVCVVGHHFDDRYDDDVNDQRASTNSSDVVDVIIDHGDIGVSGVVVANDGVLRRRCVVAAHRRRDANRAARNSYNLLFQICECAIATFDFHS
jgi:hypothetical protein